MEKSLTDLSLAEVITQNCTTSDQNIQYNKFEQKNEERCNQYLNLFSMMQQRALPDRINLFAHKFLTQKF